MVSEFLTFQNILILVAFLVIVFLLYKLFRVAIKAIVATIAGFSFPWIVSYLNLPLPITPDIDTGIKFALIALGLFLAANFFHFITHFFKILSWPFRRGKK